MTDQDGDNDETLDVIRENIERNKDDYNAMSTDTEPTDDSEGTVRVEESKWNASAVYNVYWTTDRDTVREAARRFFKEEYGHDPTTIVAEQNDIYDDRWKVIVKNGSSGTLKGARDMEL